MDEFADKNKILEDLIQKDKISWGEKIGTIIKMSGEVSKIGEAQVLMLSYRHQLVDAMTDTHFNLYKINVKFEKAFKERYLWYMNNQDRAFTGGERDKFVRADLSELKRQSLMVESHIEFYRECIKTLDNLGFAIKRRMELATEF
jgi:hypothetical protein